MKQQIKRIFCLFLMLVMIISVIPGDQLFAAKDPSILFEDDFSKTDLSGWSNKKGSVDEGVYSLGQDSFNSITAVGEQTDCIITADVSVNIGKDASGTRQGGTASLVLRAGSDGASGYEFGLGVTKSGSGYLRLYRRGSGDSSIILLQKSTDITGVEKISRKTNYTLTLGIIGQRILCYINGHLFADITDATYASGTVGIKTMGATGTFDNVKVQSVMPQEVESLEVVSHSKEVSKIGKVYVDFKVHYNSVYPPITLNQDSEGVVLSGHDGTVGERTVTVTYGGKSTSFPLKVTESFNAKLLLKETFDGDLSAYNGGIKEDESGFVYKFVVQDGKAVATTPTNNTADKPAVVNLNAKEEVTKNWTQYVMSAEMAVTEDAKTKTARAGQAALIVAKNAKNGENYTFRISTDGKVTIYCGGELLYSTDTQTLKVNYTKGRKVGLGVRVYNDHTEFYCANKLVYVCTSMNSETIVPHVGLSAINSSCWFDNWSVKELETRGEHTVKSFEIVSTATLSKVTSMTTKSLSLSDLVLQVTYTDGTIGYVGISNKMLSEYNPTSTNTQTITVTYAGQKKSFQYRYIPYLFYDDFTNGYSSAWSLGTGALSSYSATNGKLNVAYKTGNSASAVTGTVSGGENWTNYAVSADVFFDSGSRVGRQRVMSVVARRKGNSYYDFRLFYEGSSLRAALYRFDNGAASALQTFNTAQLRNCVGETKALGLGVEYNIKMEVRGSTIKCYVDNVFLSAYTDNSPNALTSGTAGIRAVSNTGTYDNFIVQEKSAGSISALRLSGTKNNEVHLFTGFDVDVTSYTLDVVDADGSSYNVPLRVDMISDFDNTALGRQKITLTYEGFSYPATVIISERPEVLKAFEKEVKAIDVDESVKMQEKVQQLKEKYDSFSPYEISQLSKTVTKRYAEILEKIERHNDKNLKKLDLIWADEINESTEETWGEGLEGNRGKWFDLNGSLYQAQRAYNIATTGWRCPDLYGELYSISADLTMLSQDMYMGISINMNQAGYYHTRITSKNRNEKDEVIYVVQLLKKTSYGHTVVGSANLSTFDINLALRQKFNLRLTHKDGLLSVYVNNTLVLNYDDSTNNNRFTVGECGLRISEGDGLYDNIRVYGKKLERPENEQDPIEPTYYKDNFDDEALGSSPSHWQENYTATSTVNNWKVYEKNGSRVYGTEVANGRTETWLHVFEKNPLFTTDFMVGKASKEAKVGFITRRSPDTAYVNIGYDFKKSKWFIVSQESEKAGEVVHWADKTSELKKGEWYTAKVEAEGKKVTLYINNKKVLESEKVARTGFGRLGFFTENATMYVDNIDHTFAYGDIPQDGLLSYVIEPEKYSGFLEIESLGDGKLIGVGENVRKMSTDNGQTWVDITDDESWSGTVTNIYTTFLKLKSNGKYIQVLQDQSFAVQTSTDMKNWTTIGQMLPDEDLYSDKGYSWALVHVNSATEYEIEDGKYRIFCPVSFRKYNSAGDIVGHFSRIFYSDDAGVTWTASETSTKDILPGYEESDASTWAESKIVQCDDGTLRMYYSRNYLGCMQYTESKDNGKTWSGLYQIPEMQCAMTSFNVIEDPTEPGTYYMVWNNGEAEYLGSSHPRVSPCLLRSRDGKNWEFLMRCEYLSRYKSIANEVELYQIIDPSLQVTKDYVYVTFGRSEREYSDNNAASHQAQRCYYLRIKKDKLEARAWDASTVANMNYPKTIEFDKLPQTKFGLNDLFNTIGATIKITGINGKTRTEKMEESCSVYVDPNMSKLGTITIPVYYKNGYQLTYDINIVPSYIVKWTISDGGTVEPKVRRVMEGDDFEVKLIPDNGYKVDYVEINGKNTNVINKTILKKDIRENLDVNVVFREITWLDYAIWIAGGVVLLGGIGSGVYLVIRKKRKNMTKEVEN